MIKLRRIECKLHEEQQSQRHVYFQFRDDRDEEREGFYMTKKNWVEMGCPSIVTVSVEAGAKISDTDAREENVLDRIPSRLPNVAMQMHQDGV